MKTSIIGYPRIGSQRELKIAEEKYFKGEISLEELGKIGKELRLKKLLNQLDSGIDFSPSNDFSFCDGRLDTAAMLNTLPDRPYVFVNKNNPLAKKKTVLRQDLLEYPWLTYGQGVNNSFYFSEEPHSTDESPKSIVVADRATLFDLLIGLNGYTISSGILSSDLNGTGIVAVPLKSNEVMDVGYIHSAQQPLNGIAERYPEHFRVYMEDYKQLTD